MSARLSLEDALAADDCTLALDILMSDHLAALIPSGKRSEWVDEALSAGQALAETTRLAHGNLSPRQLAAESGVTVRVQSTEKQIGLLMFVATYEPRPPTITLYRSPLSLLHGAVESRGRAEDFPELDEVAIAHELFHHLDQTQANGSIGKRFEVTTWRFGRWKRRAVVQRATEIAAHSFASTLLNLKRFPGVLDYLMMYR